jgi:hypothetical protein
VVYRLSGPNQDQPSVVETTVKIAKPSSGAAVEARVPSVSCRPVGVA